jgi:hypothetical protein
MGVISPKNHFVFFLVWPSGSVMRGYYREISQETPSLQRTGCLGRLFRSIPAGNSLRHPGILLLFSIFFGNHA